MSRALTKQEPNLAQTSFSSRAGNVLDTLPASISVLLIRKLGDNFEPTPLPNPPMICFPSKTKWS